MLELDPSRRFPARRSPKPVPTNADGILYLDSSALVKLVVREQESEALARHLRERRNRASCALARVEVVRRPAR
jgi:hypothetical protein